jgi:hypothetical protein
MRSKQVVWVLDKNYTEGIDLLPELYVRCEILYTSVENMTYLIQGHLHGDVQCTNNFVLDCGTTTLWEGECGDVGGRRA